MTVQVAQIQKKKDPVMQLAPLLGQIGGSAVGAYFGGPVGAQAGGAAGGAFGSMLAQDDAGQQIDPARTASDGYAGYQFGQGMQKPSGTGADASSGGWTGGDQQQNNISAAERALARENANTEIQQGYASLSKMDPQTQAQYKPILEQAMVQSGQQTSTKPRQLPMRTYTA